MTRDDIIRMAREAGTYRETEDGNDFFVMPESSFERFYHLAVAAEREACAKVADAHDFYGVAIANDIRARGDSEAA